jgi:hypothetical protein
MYTTIYAKIRMNMDKHGEAMSDILNKDVPFPPHYSAYTLMKLKHVWMRLSKILCVYLIQWLPFFSMLMMLLCCEKYDHAYKDF